MIRPGEPVSLEGGVVIRIQVVDTDDPVAVIEQAPRNVETDEARDTGDKHVHCISSRNHGVNNYQETTRDMS